MNPSTTPAISPRTPRLALVLGSGGVRSAAAIGVADVLHTAGVPIDLVVGTSSGALFGAVVAAGWGSEVAMQAATTLWSQEVTEQKRWRAYLELLMPGWAGFGPAFAMRSDRLIAQRLQTAFGDRLIERLALPLRVVTTEAATGARHVISQGPLVPALRASMALPFIFPSVQVGERRLVDGVLSDPLPVDVARDADVVLAIGFPGALPRRVDRASRLVAQCTTAIINNLQAARIEAARARGQRLLMLDIDAALERRVGLWEAAAMPYLFDVGRRVALQWLPHLIDELRSGQRPVKPRLQMLA